MYISLVSGHEDSFHGTAVSLTKRLSDIFPQITQSFRLLRTLQK